MKKKIIYLVTSGSYSDYRIDSVFDSEELAQKFINSFSEGGYNEMTIEEFTLNENETQLNKGYKFYFVRMDKEGNTIEIKNQSYYTDITDCKSYGFDINNRMYNHTYAKDGQHAVKITNELRIQLLTNNLWI